MSTALFLFFFFFFQAEDGIRDLTVTGVQTCALPVAGRRSRGAGAPPDGPSRRAVLQRQRSARGTVHATTGRGVSPRRGAEPPVYGSSRSRRSPHHAETRVGPHYLSPVAPRQTTPAG